MNLRHGWFGISICQKIYGLLAFLAVSLMFGLSSLFLMLRGERPLSLLVLFGSLVCEGLGIFLLFKLVRRMRRSFKELDLIKIQQRQAEDTNKNKSLFLANMSHEIRAPLGAMLGFVELLRDTGLSEIDRRQYLDIVERTGESLVTIVDDILDLSKVEAGKLEIESAICHLPTLFEDLERLLSLRCQRKGIFLNCKMSETGPEWVYTDPVRLKQILLNVIGNAIKFTNEGGVRVTCEFEQKTILFRVADTGIGIATENQGKLFMNFSQIDLAAYKNQGGAGLGLCLSRRLAQLLGGDVYLEKSFSGIGSTFVIRVSLVPAKKTEVSPGLDQNRLDFSPSVGFQFCGKKIFLIDDSLDSQFLVRQFLGKTGAEMAVASNGLEGVDRVLHEDFDVVIMDMQMPVMDGYTATEKLRRTGYRKPILALTAHAMKEDLAKAREVGCDDVLTKPISRTQLLEFVARHCH